MRQWKNQFVFIGVLNAVGWLVYFARGQWLAYQLSILVGAKLLEKAQGKFTDPTVFLHGRFYEALLLLSVASGLWIGTITFDKLLRRWKVYRNAQGVGLGVLGFVALNVWLAVAGQTCAFWIVFYDRTYIDNFAQFHIKKALMPEQHAPNKALLIGNSQTCSNLDERVINRLMADQVWTTEVHQSGACGFDLLMLMRDLRQAEADVMICYVTAGYFYGRTNGKVASQFFGVEELPDLFQLRGWSCFPPGALRSGLIGNVLPIYRYRLSLSQLLLGGEITHLAQQSFDASLTPDLPRQARERAPGLRITDGAEFEKEAFAQTVAELVGAGHKLLLIAGQMYPVLEQEMDPAIRPDMLHFLRTLEAQHRGKVTVMEQEDFFTPTNEDFSDLVHFNNSAQERMSRLTAEVLQQRYFFFQSHVQPAGRTSAK